MSTNVYHINAFCSQFAFLCRLNLKPCCPGQAQCNCSLHGDKYVNPAWVCEVEVSRVSKELLGDSPYEYYANGDPIASQRYFLIDSSGNIIFEIGAEFITGWESGSIGESILGMKNPDFIEWIVSVYESYRDGRLSVVVYKKSKKFTLSQWVEGEESAATQWIANKLAETDKERE